VLEEEFKTRLGKLVNPSKITVIPHGIDTNIKVVNKDMRKSWKLKKNDFVVLYFGYLTWYKGVDFLIKALKNVDSINGKNIKLVVAGGSSFTQEEKIHYQKFLKEVKAGLNGASNIISTGFVKEEDITPVFKAADLAVFPYRVFMSSSGPLSLAISHNKPFILSEELGALTHSLDIERAIKNAGLNQKDITFKLNKNSLVKAITKSMDPKIHTKMIKLSKNLNSMRAYSNLAKKYEEIIYSTALGQKKLFSFPYSLIRN
jgi:glycosyltransferase involved in cell wall biosynthesis